MMGENGNDIGPTEIDTEEAFSRALQSIIRSAETNDVDVRGSWPTDTDAASWDVEITTLVGRP